MTAEIQIGKSHYKIACEEHEKEKLQNLAERLNRRMDELTKSLKVSDEKMLLVMSALAMEEELRIEEEKFGADEVFDSISNNIDNISNYIEKLTKKIQKF
jgi:cell division protein ZapA (FtsZ GTPase activity inhibitor)